jgi:hypothetical protein
MSCQGTPLRGTAERRRPRAYLNRLLLVISLLATVVGVALGHTFTTWLNATLI